MKQKLPIAFLLFLLMANTVLAEGGICQYTQSYQYVIITSELLKNQTGDYSLSHLKEHRIANGLSSTIVTIEEIKDNYTGRDDAEQMRNFIKDAKENWGAEFILLAGDVNILPHRKLFALNKYIASDMYFACLDGDFNANGNDKWGEVDDGLDFEYDVYVGRASANDATEMSNFVYKTITYENSPINASYHTKVMHYNANDQGIGVTYTWPDEYLSLNDKLTMEYHFLTPEASDAVVLPRLSSGNLGYYLGASHGTRVSLGNINMTEADNLSNGDKFFFVASIACLTGKFENDCVAEHLTTSTRTGGAFAGFFNSQTAYGNVTQYLRTMRDAYFLDGVNQLGKLRAVIATNYTTAQYLNNENNRYLAYHFNLLGDPAAIWKMKDSEPIDLSLQFDEEMDNITDYSGNANQVNVVGGLNSIETEYGKSLQFDVEGKYLSVAHNKWCPMGDQKEITLMMRLKPSELNIGDVLLAKGSTSNPFKATLEEEGRVKVLINENNPLNAIAAGEYVSDFKLKQDEWNHLVIRLDHYTGKISFFMNGLKDKEVNMPDNYNLGVSSEPLYIGADPSSNYSGYKGLMDDVDIYSCSMSDEEIERIATWIDYDEVPAAPDEINTVISELTDVQVEWEHTSGRVHNFVLEYSNDNISWETLGEFDQTQFSYLHSGLDYDTKCYYRIKAVNNIGVSPYTYSECITTASMPTTNVPEPWKVRAIGSQQLDSYTLDRNDTVYIKAAEKDIWGTEDTFNFMYTSITGDAEVMVKIVNMEGDDEARMGGVMIRETLDSNSKHASLLLIQKQGTIFRRRETTGGTSSQLWNNGGNRTPPYWLKLERKGDMFSGYYSKDGITWTLQEQYQFSMNEDVYVGIAATSHSETTTMDAVFTGLQVKNQALPVDVNPTDNKLLVYPNPSSGVVNIKGLREDEKFSVYNSSGILIMEHQYDKLDVSHLVKGVYFIKTRLGNAKLIVK